MKTTIKTTDYAVITYNVKKATKTAINYGWGCIIEKIHESKIGSKFITTERYYAISLDDFLNTENGHKYFSKYQ
jgi:hypothetical protein